MRRGVTFHKQLLFHWQSIQGSVAAHPLEGPCVTILGRLLLWQQPPESKSTVKVSEEPQLAVNL